MLRLHCRNRNLTRSKKLLLNEFGRSGLEGELIKLEAEPRKDRNGQAETARKGVPR